MIVEHTCIHAIGLRTMSMGSTQSGPVPSLDPSKFVIGMVTQFVPAFVSRANSSSSLFVFDTLEIL